MAMNTNLLKALTEIVSKHGGVAALSNAQKARALLADLAANEPKPQKNALAACIERGFVPMLQNVPAGERRAAKAKLAARLNREEGLDATLCADTLDLLEAALPGGVSPEAASPDVYYLSVNYQQIGPFTLEQVKSMIRGGLVAKDHRIRQGEKAAWSPVTRQPELKPLFADAGNTGGKSRGGKAAPGTSASKQQPPQGRQDGEVWRELRTLTRHTEGVYSVVYSPDGCRIASASGDNTVRIWDVENERKLRTFKFEEFPSWGLAYSPDGRCIIFRPGDDHIIRIWDVESGRELQTLKGHTDRVISGAYSPDGRRIASGSWDHTVRIWVVESGRELQTLKGHTEVVISVAYSPNGRRIASGSWDHTVRIWDAESGRELLTLWGHTDRVYSMAYSPDGRCIASGSLDNTVRIWDAESGYELGTLEGHTEAVCSVAYSPDGRRIASGSWDHTVRIWGKE
ncbi:MAG: GYF domain-containing protein [Spirochaetaceae bacterium]|jgi:WD40 repeat protein|nr:GYF domain-containing protein [Spirochaetaceae bacterium]